MNKNQALALFEGFEVRRIFDEKTETCYFSVVDIVAALIQQPDYQTARKYWNKLKERLKKEGSQSVTNCHQLKMMASDGKMRLTDVAAPPWEWMSMGGRLRVRQHNTGNTNDRQ